MSRGVDMAVKTNDSKRDKLLMLSLACLILVAVGIFSVRLGSVEYSFSEILKTISNREMTTARNIIMNIRLPRVAITMIVGANLAVSGALLQAVMQNPLADPGITGVSAGASLAAITIMLVFPQHSNLVPIFAFVGGVISCTLVYLLAWKDGIKPLRIILAGVAINAMLGGGTSLLSILYSDRIQGVLLWVNGSMSGKSWGDVKTLLIYSVIGLFLSILCIRKANVLQLGDEMSLNLGVDTNKYRALISLVAVFLASISTAIVGLIGFVGLIVPHISRLMVGSNHKYLIPFSMVVGSITLTLGDTFARTVASPIELPVGIVMAVVGGPFFLYLLRKGQKK